MEITITEALAELKTIAARIKKNRDAIVRYSFRPGDRKDPLEKEGGSEKFVAEKRQAISDLQKRFVDIRTAIMSVNLVTKLTLHDQTMSLQEWLTWRRDISVGEMQFLTAMTTTLDQHRRQVPAQTYRRPEEPAAETPQLVVAFSEKTLAEETEKLQQLIGDLDGKLALMNATVKIDLP